MANQIAEKLELLNCPGDMRDNALKFSASLTCISLEELKQIIDFLTEKGVVQKSDNKIILSPKAFKILPRGLEFISARVAEMEAIGELDCYKEKPYRITIIDSDKRLKYIKDHGEAYKTADGKYSMLPFNKVNFEKKYGVIDFEKEMVAPAPVETSQDTTIPVDTLPPVENIETDSIEPVTQAPLTEEVIEESPAYTDEEVQKPVDVTPVIPIDVNQTFDNERYSKLSLCLTTLYNNLFGLPSVPDDMLECLKQFMTEGAYEDDVALVFDLLTSGSDYSEEAKNMIHSSIEQVVGEQAQVRMVA